MKKNKEEKKEVKRGRPSIYSEELAKEICSRLMTGESLRKICEDETMPGLRTVCTWLIEEDKEYFQQQYARAREVQAELMADELIDIADDSSNDYILTDNGLAENREFVSRSKLRVDTRKWVATKLLPKKYGDKQAIEHSGELKTGSNIDLSKISDSALDEIVNAIKSK